VGDVEGCEAAGEEEPSRGKWLDNELRRWGPEKRGRGVAGPKMREES